MAFELPKLPYDYNALEPHIDEQTMRIHHTKHHQGYVDKTNKALEGHANLQSKSIEDLLRGVNDLPDSIRTAINNNGGGHANHSIFWSIMSPKGGGDPEGDLAAAIKSTFGNVDDFRSKFEAAAAGQFGSGWAWLSLDSQGNLDLKGWANQDSPYTQNLIPILGIDVWEHAYYLKYQNKRPDYISAWWSVVCWKSVGERYSQAKAAVGK